MKKWHEQIVIDCRARPGQYVKLDDIAVRLGISNSVKWGSFKRAYDDLIASGRVVIIGNAIKVNQ